MVKYICKETKNPMPKNQSVARATQHTNICVNQKRRLNIKVKVTSQQNPKPKETPFAGVAFMQKTSMYLQMFIAYMSKHNEMLIWLHNHELLWPPVTVTLCGSRTHFFQVPL